MNETAKIWNRLLTYGVFTLLLILFLFPSLTLQAKEKEFEQTDAYALVGDQPVALLKNRSDEYRLFLPACAEPTVPFFKDGVEYTLHCRAETNTVDGIRIHLIRGSLPSLFITLDGGDADFVRIGRVKGESASGSLVMLDTDGDLIYAGPVDKMWSHGNTSFRPSSNAREKNPYNLKLGKKAELIKGAGKLKKYVLLSPRRQDAPYNRDTTGMAQLSAFAVYSALADGELADVKGTYVDLYVNGEYRGFYVLAERINNGGALDLADLQKSVTNAKSELIKVSPGDADPSDPAIKAGVLCYSYSKGAEVPAGTDITGGYVLEATCAEMYSGCGFKTALGLCYEIKYPDYCTQDMVVYIATLVQSFERAICSKTGYYNGKHFSEYGDLRSLADQILTYGFFVNFEIYQTSTYLYKDAGDGPITFGPGWDFESPASDLSTVRTVFDTVFTYYGAVKSSFLQWIWRWGDFLKILDEENQKMERILRSLLKNGSVLYDYADSVQGSVAMNAARWSDAILTYTAYDYIDAIAVRFDTWYQKLWNPEHYLIYTEIKVTDNGDGTVTLSLLSKGDVSKTVWRKVEDGYLKLLCAGTDAITVPADGTQYICFATGRLNAYFPASSNRFFSSKEYETLTFPVEAKAADVVPADSETETEPVTDQGPHRSAVVPILLCAAAAAAVSGAVVFIVRRRNRPRSA